MYLGCINDTSDLIIGLILQWRNHLVHSSFSFKNLLTSGTFVDVDPLPTSCSHVSKITDEVSIYGKRRTQSWIINSNISRMWQEISKKYFVLVSKLNNVTSDKLSPNISSSVLPNWFSTTMVELAKIGWSLCKDLL